MSNQTTTLTPSTPRPAHPAAPGHGPVRGRPWPGRLWRGHTQDAPWVRPALLALVAVTGVLYLWGLGASGWANSYYAAAAQAGSESWKAFFFGASDAASSITVDKTPMSVWVMALSVRVFGLSSWSLLVPQALMGVGTVALLYATVRRTTGSAAAGLLAGAVMALTPVAVLMFRFDNPDALLVLLLVGAGAATLRAVEASDPARAGSPLRWLALAGALVGLAFLTKMLQAFLVLPALAAAYLLAAHTPLGRRIAHLLVAFASMVVAGGWWVAIVELWPAASRPYIGGSQTNSVLELTLGYNGLGRLTGDEEGSVGGGRGWGQTGLLRLLDSEIGGQVAWLLPAALVLLVAGLWFTRRRPRTDGVRAALVLWGGWLVVTAATFSLMAGIFHAYYTVALAPAVAALIGVGGWVLWQRRDSDTAALTLAGVVALSAVFAFVLLQRTPDFVPWLRWAVLVLGLAAALLMAGLPHLPVRGASAVAGLAVGALLLGPAAYSVSTAATPHTGAIPSAGPAASGGPSSGPGGAPGVSRGFAGGFPGGAPGGFQGAAPGGVLPGGIPGGFRGGAPVGGGAGGLLQGSTASAAMTELLQTDAEAYTWVAATVGANSAAGYQLAAEESVMAIGGFNGTDPSPTLEQFQQYVADGEIHYFIAGGAGGPGSPGIQGGPGGFAQGGSSESSSIVSWVEESFTAATVDGVTVYDLSDGVR